MTASRAKEAAATATARNDGQSRPPSYRDHARSNLAIKANQLKELQLRLFPELPDDRRAAPNVVVRSSVFGVVRRGNRVRVTDLPVAAPQGLEIAITGWRLDQHDLDIWLEIMHAAGGAKPGEEVRFQLQTLIKRLGHKSRVAKVITTR